MALQNLLWIWKMQKIVRKIVDQMFMKKSSYIVFVSTKTNVKILKSLQQQTFVTQPAYLLEERFHRLVN